MRMLNGMFFFIWVLVIFGIITATVTAQLPPNTTILQDNGDTSHRDVSTVQPPIPTDSNPSNFLEEEEEDEEDLASTLVPETTTTLGLISSTLTPEISTSVPGSGCPDIGPRPTPGTLVKCHCKGNEILEKGQCQPYPEKTLIEVQKSFTRTKKVDVTNYEVIIKAIKCDTERSHPMNFTQGQFYLRARGDMVLSETAGELNGLRINKYCITHLLDGDGSLTWTMSACIPIPAVPRCCPPGQTMKDGLCQPANTPDFSTPPIAAEPFGPSVEWPYTTNYLSPLTCTVDPVYTIPLGYKEANLVSLANGLAVGWVPIDGVFRRKYYYCPNYCIDGKENPEDGSVSFTASFCFTDPKVQHEEMCAGQPCVRKCCKPGEVMDVNIYRCVPDPKSTFNPYTTSNLSNYNTVTGWPLCSPSSKIDGKYSVDKSGTLLYDEKTFPATDFCLDTFVNKSAREQSALACLAVTSLWQDIRPTLFPVCNAISLIFLSITIGCHLFIPKLLKNGGIHQLCHAIALAIAYLSSFIVNIFHNHLTDNSCFNTAIAMQLGFLMTFFWLNVMCLEIWRKIRRLKNYRPCKDYPTYCYMLYAWGIPCVISLITVLMQFYAPDDVPGVIKPYIGHSRCWFQDDLALLAYFYGPIAFLFVCNTVFLSLTYYNYKQMLKSYQDATKTLKEMGTGIGRVSANQKSTSSMPSRQITDHVQEFKQKLQLFVLMATCWVTEVLSWKIPPLEMWALTDTLNSLQGLCIFIILLSNRNKRKVLEEKFPLPFRIARKSLKIPSKIKKLLGGDAISLSPVNSFASTMSRKFSDSTVMSSFTTSIKSSSTSSFSVGVPSVMAQRSVSLVETDSSVVTISHSPLQSSQSYNCAKNTSPSNTI